MGVRERVRSPDGTRSAVGREALSDQRVKRQHRVHPLTQLVGDAACFKLISHHARGDQDQKFGAIGLVVIHAKKMADEGSGFDLLQKLCYLELKIRLAELLLMRVDKMTMAASVEARVPYLDHKLVEFAVSLPIDLKIRGNQLKYIMKQAASGLVQPLIDALPQPVSDGELLDIQPHFQTLPA